MEKYSGSHTTSRKSSLPHNRREEEFTGKNVDPNGVHEQWFRKDIDVLYDELFSDSIARYNAKQKRNDRKIDGSKAYLESIRNEWETYYNRGLYKYSKDENGKRIKENGKFKTEFVRPFKDYDDALNHLNYNPSRNPRSEYYESIVQIGNSKNQPSEDVSKAILKRYFDTFEKRNPNLKLMECHYHADEATPHIHLDFVPVATGYKQGLDVQNGFDKALMQQMGLSPSESKRKTPSVAWYEQEQQALAEIALEYGVEIDNEHEVLEPGKKEHESVKAYKARMEGLAELEDKEYDLELKEMDVNDKDVLLQNREYLLDKRENSLEARSELLDKKEVNISSREKKLVQSEYELSRGKSKNSLKENELNEREDHLIKQERSWKKDLERLKQSELNLIQEVQRLNAEKERLDVEMSSNSVVNFVKWAKNSYSKDGRTFFEAWSEQFVKPWLEKQRQKQQSKQIRTGIQNVTDEFDSGKANSEAMKRGNYIPKQDSNSGLER